MIDVRDGKILRVSPFNFDWKSVQEKIGTWKERFCNLMMPTAARTSYF
jgi:hypothetical protein